MVSANAKPPYNAKRRIQYLFGFSIFLIVAATAGWYFVAGKINEAAQNAITAQRTQGVNIDCPNRAVKGYPFRFGVFCDSVSISVGSRGSSFDAGALRSAAQFYDPFRVLVEMDSPARLSPEGGLSYELAWSSMRATSVVANPLPKSISIVGTDFSVSEPSAKYLAEQIEGHMRLVGKNVDVAARIAELGFETGDPQIDELPPLGVDFDVRLIDAVEAMAAGAFNMRGQAGELNRAAIMLNTDRGLLVTGPFSVDGAGLVDAQLVVRIVDVDAVFDLVAKSLPQLAPMLSAFANGQPRTGEKGDEIELKITISKSQARMGLFPLGTLPPL